MLASTLLSFSMAAPDERWMESAPAPMTAQGSPARSTRATRTLAIPGVRTPGWGRPAVDVWRDLMTVPGDDRPQAAMVVPRFYIRQRITLMVNRYEIRAADPDGSEGRLLAFAEQRRMKLKEEVDFYTDESKTRRVFGFKARQRLDVHAEHDVYDEHGAALGYF